MLLNLSIISIKVATILLMSIIYTIRLMMSFKSPAIFMPGLKWLKMFSVGLWIISKRILLLTGVSADTSENRERLSTLVFGPTFDLLEQFNPDGLNTLTVDYTICGYGS